MEWYYLAAISAIALGASTIMEKLMLKDEHATVYSTIYTIMTAVICLFLIPFSDFSMSLQSFLAIAIAAVLTAFSYLMGARLFRHNDISMVSPVSIGLPTVFVVLLAFVFLSEKLTLLQYAAVIGIFLSLISLLLTRDSKLPSLRSSIKDPYILGSLLFSIATACGAIIAKYVLSYVSAVTYFVAAQELRAIIMLAVIAARKDGISSAYERAMRDFVPLAAIAAISFVSGITFILAMASAEVSLVQPLRSVISVIMTVVIGGEVFKEKGVSKRLAIGILMAVFAFILIS